MKRISGIYTLFWPTRGVAKNNVGYYKGKLLLDGELIRAYIWLDRCRKDVSPLLHGGSYRVTGVLRTLDGLPVIDVTSLEPLYQVSDKLLLPAQLCPVTGLLDRFKAVLGQVTIEPLIQFVIDVFSDQELGTRLLTCPASIGYHHNYAGGLLEHSIECAESVAAEPNISAVERQLGIIAALLHDIGKTRFFSADLKFLQVALNSHDSFTLYLLAPYLKRLEAQWSDGAEALIYLWEWLGQGKREAPAIGAAVALKKADELSCSMFNSRQAFIGQPEWKRLASQNGRRDFRLEAYRERALLP